MIYRLNIANPTKRGGICRSAIAAKALLRPLRSEQSMFRFRTTKQVLFECEARVHLLNLKRLQLISE